MYDVTAMGELLIDFTPQGNSARGMRLFEQNPGGAPANVACALSKLGAKSAFIGKVGCDMHGDFLRETLRREGVETCGLLRDPDFFTTLAFVALDDAGERVFSFARKPGADTMLRPEEIRTDLIEQSTVFHLGSLSLTGEPSRSATHFALRTAREAKRYISYDPNYRASLWPDEETAIQQMRSILPFVHLLKCSDGEAFLLTGEAKPQHAAERLAAEGIPVVVVTLGADGAYVRTREGGAIAPPSPGKRVDATGAGDSFWGAFLYRFLQNGKAPEELSLREALSFARFANAAASLCIEGYGAIPSLPELDVVLAHMNDSILF